MWVDDESRRGNTQIEGILKDAIKKQDDGKGERASTFMYLLFFCCY